MTNHPLEELAKLYLSHKNLSKSTIKSYQICFRTFIHYLKEEDILYAKTHTIILFREYLRDKGYSTYYIHIHLSALKVLYHFLSKNYQRFNLSHLYAYNITLNIKDEKIKHMLRKPVLTKDQAKHLLDCTKKNRKYIWDYRNHAIIYVMLTSGLRMDEIIHAKIMDLEEQDGKMILKIQSKDHLKESITYLSDGAKKALNDYLRLRKDHNPYLFIAHKNASPNLHLADMFFRTMFHKLINQCGLNGLGITPHCLRHTAALFNLERGASTLDTKMLLRHENISSTMIYQDYLDQLKDDSEYQIDEFILREEELIIYLKWMVK